MQLHDVLARLNKVEGNGKQYSARCPSHKDETNSLSITANDEKIAIHCHAGCDKQNILDAMGLKLADLFLKPLDTQKKVNKNIEYPYYNEDGTLIHKTVRKPLPDGKKKFLQCRPDGNGGWIWNLQDITPILYNLRALIDAVAKGETVYIVEGEKDVESLKVFEMVATTNPMGAGKWKSDYNSYFKGADVIILPDNDVAGQKHSANVLKNLRNIAKSVKIVRLPDLAEKGDVSDWIQAGGTKEQLLVLVNERAEQLEKLENTKKINDFECIFDTNLCTYVKSTDTYKPMNLKENILVLLSHHNIKVKYNQLSKNMEIIIPECKASTDNCDEVCLEWIFNKCVRHNFSEFSKERLSAILLEIGDENKYNPAKEYLEEAYKNRDKGIGNITKLLDTIHAPTMEEKLKVILVIKWLVSCVAKVYSEKGISTHGVLVLQGNQGIGKTTWFKKLVPNLEWFRDGVTLDANSKDSVLTAIQYWVVELGELEATFKKDIASLKAFITKDVDVIRRPYARKDSHYPRRTVFCGSVNSDEFLKDDTGNRRFWVIPCESIDYKHDIDIQKVWGEVVHLYKNGYLHYLTSEEEEMLSKSNKTFDQQDVTDASLELLFDWDSPKRYWMKSIDIYGMLNDVDLSQGITPTKISQALRKRSKTWSNGIDYRTYSGTKQFSIPKLKSRYATYFQATWSKYPENKNVV